MIARASRLFLPTLREAPADAEKPSTEPSSLTSVLYKAMEKVFRESASNALVVPFLIG